MTFTEAAIEVLRREGKPLHFKKIAEIAVRENLLDHIGKIPDEVMGGQLANHCRLPHTDRHVMVVQPGTFALVEWGLDEDLQGLDSVFEPPPENEPAYRARERHPIPSKEMARTVGRGSEQRARRREEGDERRARKFPPPAEVAFEILAGADRPLSVSEIAAQGAERALMPDAFVRDSAALAAALGEDNRRRESAGRKPLFAIEGETVSLAAQPEPGERAAVVPVVRPVTPGDLRRTGLAALRRRLRECDGATLEHIASLLLDRSGFREIKVAKRGREHVVYTARKKLGLAEVRHCVRVMRGSGEVSRRDVTELRRDIGNYGAQIGVVLSPGEPGREARGEAVAPGQLPVLLLCGEALAETMAELTLGCRLITVPEVDEAFFKAATDAATQEESGRKARREDRDRRDGESRRDGEPRDERRGREDRGREERPREERSREERPRPRIDKPAPESQPAAAIEEAASTEVPAESGAERRAGGARPDRSMPREVYVAGTLETDDGDEEGDEGEVEDEGPEPGEAALAAGEAAPAATGPDGEPRKRRRRRRRRGGRGRGERREGAAPPAAQGAPGASGEGAPGAAAESARPVAEGALPEPSPSEGGRAEASASDAAASEPRPPPLPAATDEHREPALLPPPLPGGEEPR